jgi:cell surface protein SprA
MSFRDNINIIYELTDATQGEPSRGQKALMIEPSLEYQLYKNLALRWFGSYQTSKPYNTEQNGFVAFQTGFTVRFNFN